MRLAILGSCVTRDAFAAHEDELGRPEWYFARSGLPSAMSSEVFGGVDLSTIDSPFQRGVVEADLDGSFLRFARSGEHDLLVHDPIDERFQLLYDGSGAIATRSPEFTRATYDASGCATVAPHTDDYYARWEPAWRRLVDTLRGAGTLHLLRVNRVRWADRLDSPDFPAVYTQERIDGANAFLERLYERMGADLVDQQFFTYPTEELVAATEHRWGLAPFHYAPGYYRRLADHVLHAVAEPIPPTPPRRTLGQRVGTVLRGRVRPHRS